MAGKTGVSFDEVHSYTDWHLRLKQIEIGLPEAYTEYVEVPGMNGYLDLTEAQYGGVTYGMRTLKFTFDARDCTYIRWPELLSRIAKDLHGKEKRIILDIDSGYYYSGRCSIDTQKTNEVLAEIGIECYCNPYKIDVTSSDEPWKWDTFSFIDGIIRSTSDISINSTSGWQEVILAGYAYNETLTIVSNAAMLLKYRNGTYSITAGENIMYDVQLYEGDNELYFQGQGTITIVHRGGRI